MKIGWPQLSHWFHRYEQAVLGHKISIEDAVKQYLKDPNLI
jgi:hypothetical protein